MYYYNQIPYFNNDFNSLKYKAAGTYFLSVEGNGSVTAAPDLAVIFLGVITEDPKLAEAQKQNSEKAKKVISSLLKLGIKEKDIKTENYSVDPQYDFVEGKQVFRGYRVTNNLRITVKDMKSIGTIIDTAIENGANVVYNVNFTIEEKDIYYKKALSLALINAVEKAKSIEKTLNVEVHLTPIKIVEEPAGNIQARDAYAIKAPASPTPIMAGELEVRAKVNALFRYTERL
jgi:uncharacterized protein YggE